MELTEVNMSVDILTGVIFLMSVWRGVVALYYNHLNLRAKIYIGFFVVSSALYLFQTIMQTQTGMVASTAIWNVINGMHAFLALSIVTLLAKESEK